MQPSDDPLADARHLGRLEGERFVAHLRAAELHERQERLTRLAASHADDDVTGPLEENGAAWRLRQEVERLTAFHDAVVQSRAWRLVQAVRRPFGRAW